MLNRLPDDTKSGWEGSPPQRISEQKCADVITRDNFQACGLDVVQEDFLSPTF